VVAELGGFAERLVDNRVERDDAADELAPDRGSDRSNATLLLSPRSSRLGLGTVEAYAVYANGNAIKPAAREFIDFLAHDFRDTPP